MPILCADELFSGAKPECVSLPVLQVGSAKWDSVGRTKMPSASTGRRRWCRTLCVTWWGRAAVWAAPRAWAMANRVKWWWWWEGPNEVAATAKQEEKEAEVPPVIKEEVRPTPTAGKRRQALDEGPCRAHPPSSLTATAHVIKTGRLPSYNSSKCFPSLTHHQPTRTTLPTKQQQQRTYCIIFTDSMFYNNNKKTGRDLL